MSIEDIKVDYETTHLDLEMQLAMKGQPSDPSVFRRTGLLGRCVYNMMLCKYINGTEAVRIIKSLERFDNVTGVSSANMRKKIRETMKDVERPEEIALLPYDPVFWMMPLDKDKWRNHSNQQNTKMVVRMYDKRKPLPLPADIPDYTPGAHIVRAKPLDILHLQLLDLEEQARARKSDYKVYLPFTKMINETAHLLLKFDDNLGNDVDQNKLITQYDMIVDFVFSLEDMYPQIDIGEKFRQFMGDKL